MRASRLNEILWFLFRYGGEEGLTWRQMVGEHFRFDGQVLQKERCFPRQTLDRHLKELIKQGRIEKVQERRKATERGRQSTRYRIAKKHWQSWGCMCLRLPARSVGNTFFLGTRKRNSKTKGSYVSLFPEEKAKARRYLAQLKLEKGA